MDIKTLLTMEELKYLEIQEKLKRISQPTIDGYLAINENRGYPQYYHCIKTPSGKIKRIYIKKTDTPIIKTLARKQYHESVDRFIKSKLKKIRSCINKIDSKQIDDIYLEYTEIRQALVVPIIPTYHMLLEKWKSQKYKGLGFDRTQSEIYTKKGERVRSKSEKILADTFNDLGIEYKYECPLWLDQSTVVYPDFTFLHPKTYKEIYWEHHGMMDNLDYMISAQRKIETYEMHGITRKDNLIVSYEYSNHTLNQRWVEQLIKTYLLN